MIYLLFTCYLHACKFSTFQCVPLYYCKNVYPMLFVCSFIAVAPVEATANTSANKDEPAAERVDMEEDESCAEVVILDLLKKNLKEEGEVQC